MIVGGIGKDLKGSNNGLIAVLSRHLPTWSETVKNLSRIARVLGERPLLLYQHARLAIIVNSPMQVYSILRRMLRLKKHEHPSQQ